MDAFFTGCQRPAAASALLSSPKEYRAFASPRDFDAGNPLRAVAPLVSPVGKPARIPVVTASSYANSTVRRARGRPRHRAEAAKVDAPACPIPDFTAESSTNVSLLFPLRAQNEKENEEKKDTRPLMMYFPSLDGTGQGIRPQLYPLENAGYEVACVWIPASDRSSWAELSSQLVPLVEQAASLDGDARPAQGMWARRHVSLLAESFGAVLAFLVAHDAPHLVDRLVVLNPATNLRENNPILGAVSRTSLLSAFPLPMYRLAQDALLPLMVSRRRVHARDRDLLSPLDYLAPATASWRLAMLEEDILRDDVLRSIAQPVLLLASARDHFLPSLSETSRLAALLPCSTRSILVDSGHSALLEDGVDIVRVMLDAGLEPPEAATVRVELPHGAIPQGDSHPAMEEPMGASLRGDQGDHTGHVDGARSYGMEGTHAASPPEDRQGEAVGTTLAGAAARGDTGNTDASTLELPRPAVRSPLAAMRQADGSTDEHAHTSLVPAVGRDGAALGAPRNGALPGAGLAEPSQGAHQGGGQQRRGAPTGGDVPVGVDICEHARTTQADEGSFSRDQPQGAAPPAPSRVSPRVLPSTSASATRAAGPDMAANQSVQKARQQQRALAGGDRRNDSVSDAALDELGRWLEPWKLLTSPCLLGTENLPTCSPRWPSKDGADHRTARVPVLFVGNHTMFGLYDAPLLVHELHLRGFKCRGLAHGAHWSAGPFGELFERYGCVPASPVAAYRMLSRGEHVLLFPGGGREVAKRKGEEYQLMWRGGSASRDPDGIEGDESVDFVRMAARLKTIIVPFAALGGDDAYKIAYDSVEMLASPAGPFLRGIFDRLQLPAEESLSPITYLPGPFGHLPIPSPLPLPYPERVYFYFGKPFDTQALLPVSAANRKDSPELRALYKDVRMAVEDGIRLLTEFREKDPERSLGERLRVQVADLLPKFFPRINNS